MSQGQNDSQRLLSPPKSDPDSFAYNASEFESQVQSIQNRHNKTTTDKTKYINTQNSKQAITHSEGFVSSNGNMSKYTIFWFNKRENDKQYRLVVQLPLLATVQEAIRDILPYVNQQLKAENSNYELLNDANLYELCKAKKSGQPKSDYPALDTNQILSQTGIKNICLVETSIRAVVQRNNTMFKDEASKPKPVKTSMISPVLPQKPKTAPQSFTDDEYYDETCCLCFTTKKRVSRKFDNTLRTTLLGEF